MTGEDFVLFDVDARGVAYLTLNRPRIHNAFDDVMIGAITKHLNFIKNLREVRALVIRGKGPSFCAGADLHWMKRSADFTEKENLDDARSLALLMQTLDQVPVPTIAYVHGAVFGGGVGMLACCDMVFADYETRFSLSEVRLGLVPAVISPYVLRAIGERQARRYFLSGEKFDAAQAKHMGLVHDVIDYGDYENHMTNYLDQILACGPDSVRLAKKLIQDLEGGISEEMRRMTIKLIADVRLGAEAQAGLGAFFKKVSPPWVQRKGGRNV